MRKSRKSVVVSRESLELAKVPFFWRGVVAKCICSFILFLSISSSAQKVSAIVSRDKIRLGESFNLKLKVEPTSNAPLFVDSWFNIPDSFEHFQVVSRQPIDTINIASTKSYSQEITLTSFDTGTHSLPPFSVSVGNAKLQTHEIPISISPVDVTMKKDYNDIKDIIEPEPEQDYTLWIVTVGLIILCTIFFFIVKWMIARKNPINIPQYKSLTLEDALQKLTELESLYQSSQYKLFYIELVAICKGYSDNQLQITTYSKTTSEYVKLLKQKLKDKQLVHQYTHLLHFADKVKFAKAIPTPSECKQSLADAKSLLSAIYSSQNKNAANVE